MKQVVEIASGGLYLSKKRGFLRVERADKSRTDIDLDAIATLLISSQRTTISSALINELSKRKLVTVLCDGDYIASSIVLPVNTHGRQKKRILAQCLMSEPLKKRLWQNVVQEKIQNQALNLRQWGSPKAEYLEAMAKRVGSGDPDNKEAQAAKIYWRALLGPSFTRSAPSPCNSLLNYAYTVMRAAMIRALVLAGLQPVFALGHKQERNSFALADDLMEPLRPIVDAMVKTLQLSNKLELSTANKRILSKCLDLSMHYGKEKTFLSRTLILLAKDYVAAIRAKRKQLCWPQLSADFYEELCDLCGLTSIN